VWASFSNRGLGRYASAPDSSLISPVVESFAQGPLSPCQQ